MATQRYKVIGTQPVLGDKMPGESFDGPIDPGVESFLIGIGAIKVVSHDVEADKRINTPDQSKKAASKKKA